ncbi:hypothetical protein BJ508DRAFT_377575 [Ascobolus immersus RN42]|uniref:Uncharacterized protein n=1 Tax=Ascobolus immersus RN42 TaxID=1160509 RepID=A0A3N4I2F2_ASCIM|nr:hypothetical protein BJ508DRAFT_377575 [Ascobolus immersus RN42]
MAPYTISPTLVKDADAFYASLKDAVPNETYFAFLNLLLDRTRHEISSAQFFFRVGALLGAFPDLIEEYEKFVPSAIELEEKNVGAAEGMDGDGVGQVDEDQGSVEDGMDKAPETEERMDVVKAGFRYTDLGTVGEKEAQAIIDEMVRALEE